MDPSYSHRLEVVEKLGPLFPGKILPFGFKQRNLGYFAGIYLQTKWQKDSGRDRLPIWYLVNESVTLAPYLYSQEYLKDPNQPEKEGSPSQVWKKYFRTGSSRQLWKAHVISIKHALWQHQEELEKAKVPPEELAFWQGWIKVVFFSEHFSPPMNDFPLGPLLKLAMPTSVLDRPKQQSLIRRAFLKWVSINPLPQKEFLQLYGQLVEYT